MTKTNEANFKLMHGDCLDRLRELSDNSVDSVVTDPPYGLSKEPDIAEVLTKWIAGEPYDHGHGGFIGIEREVEYIKIIEARTGKSAVGA